MSTPSISRSPQRLHPLREGRRLLLFAGMLLTLCSALLFIGRPRLIQQTELHLYDAMLGASAPPPKTAVPVIVGIDEESLRAYGQWPWPRYRLAVLVQRLQEMGAEVVALDFLMPEPDRTAPEVIRAERERDFGAAPVARPSLLPDSNSQRLAEALAREKTILGHYFTFSGSEGGGALPPVVPEGMSVTAAGSRVWPQPSGTLRSLPLLTAAAGAEGFTNAQHDVDGVLRRVPVLLHYNGRYYPSLALGALLLAAPERTLHLVNDGSEAVLKWGRLRLPLDQSGNFMIDYRSGRKAHRYISAREILAGSAAAGSLRGKIVVVGAWARGLGDIHQVPCGAPVHGVEVHASVIDNILSGSYISRPSWAPGAELAAIVLLGLLSTILLAHARFALSLFSVVAAATACYVGGRELLQTTGIFLSPFMPMATPVVVMTVLSVLKYVIEEEKVRQRNLHLFEAQDAIIVTMSALAETRDSDMGGHVLRTRYYVEALVRHLATLPRYRGLDRESIDLMAKSAPLHDIGKIGIPDSILHKPARLTPEEFDIMKTHTLTGAGALTRAIEHSARPESLDFLRYARQMIESHHEKWDGSGYPHGLRGTEIPLAGRLMAVADVYDALVCKRVYKGRLSHAEAMETIVADAGRHFDPEVVAAFVAVNEEFLRISQMFGDEQVTSLTTPEPMGRSSFFATGSVAAGVLGRVSYFVRSFTA